MPAPHAHTAADEAGRLIHPRRTHRRNHLAVESGAPRGMVRFRHAVRAPLEADGPKRNRTAAGTVRLDAIGGVAGHLQHVARGGALRIDGIREAGDVA